MGDRKSRGRHIVRKILDALKRRCLASLGVTGKAPYFGADAPKRTGLNEVEKYFIEYLAAKRGRRYEYIKTLFLETRDKYAFAGRGYREFCHDIFNLYKIMYDNTDEKDSVDSYKFHELLHLFRMISYSYGQDFGPTARLLAEKADKRPLVIVDYGCGLGYISYAIAKFVKGSKVYLVEVDSMVLEFAKFIFDKQGIETSLIRVTKEDLYPRLPPHNICIATEVMEHLKRPMEAYAHIYESLDRGGLLFGDFEDHIEDILHVSCDLSGLRRSIHGDFQKIGDNCYRKL